MLSKSRALIIPEPLRERRSIRIDGITHCTARGTKFRRRGKQRRGDFERKSEQNDHTCSSTQNAQHTTTTPSPQAPPFPLTRSLSSTRDGRHGNLFLSSSWSLNLTLHSTHC
ncbi:uncharacterized protein LY89DRAFT_465992 [Mollisia scopiformis]|uniref:Uncharacterized protein n=1 Tax=Mollisia scopiformis TaxID=149040 RepID=A0A194XI63_MOLSC|nr:uncharacterized protein LY89DRAFT_465992 [Mollisia scopiformis]KUJ19915.1 hypothetical protein LY89DRAFT_465992 [Mollisia scopiformis]